MPTVRYTGKVRRSFVEVGDLEPGTEFNVPEHRVAGFVRRHDMELVEEPEATTPSLTEPVVDKVKTKSATGSTTPAESQEG